MPSTSGHSHSKYEEENVNSIYHMQNDDIEVVEDIKDDEDDSSLDIRNESGESYEDMVSILPSEPVIIIDTKLCQMFLHFSRVIQILLQHFSWIS